MIAVERKHLAHAVEMAYIASKTGMSEIEHWTRLFGNSTAVSVLGSGSVSTCRSVPVLDYKSDFDICVLADRLRAAVEILEEGSVVMSVATDLSSFRIQQGKKIDITFETKPSSEFPPPPKFENMTPVSAGVPNPHEVFQAIRHVAADHAGNTPLAEVLLVTKDASYLAGTISAVRCEGTLVHSDVVVGLRLNSLDILEYMGPKVNCMVDSNRLLVYDSNGWAIIGRFAGEYEVFAKKVVATFASLRQVGTVKVNRKSLMETAMAASTILKVMSKEPLFLTCECRKETLTLSAEVGRHSFRQELPAHSSSGYKIQIHAGRLISFLKNSADEDINLQVMDSDLVPRPRNAIHLTDAALHEVISLPADRQIEDLPA